MVKIRFYTDEHIARAVVRGLQQRGVEVLTCQGADMLSKADKDHLRFAHGQACVIVTQDTDFGFTQRGRSPQWHRLCSAGHISGPSHSGVAAN